MAAIVFPFPVFQRVITLLPSLNIRSLIFAKLEQASHREGAHPHDTSDKWKSTLTNRQQDACYGYPNLRNCESPTRAIEHVKRWSAEPDCKLGSACYHNGVAFSRTANAVRASPMNGTFVHKLSIRKRRCAMTLQWHGVAGQTTQATSSGSTLPWLREIARFPLRVTSRRSIVPSSILESLFSVRFVRPLSRIRWWSNFRWKRNSLARPVSRLLNATVQAEGGRMRRMSLRIPA